MKRASFPSSLPTSEDWTALSDRAARVHFEATCWSAEEQTDGVLTMGVAKAWGLKTCNELVASGRWTRTEDGYRILDFLDSNPKASAVERERAAARERMQKLRSTVERRPKKRRPEPKPGLLPPPTKAPVSAPPEAVALCDLLADLIEANGSKRPTVTERWKDEARLLLSTGRTGDGRPYEEARALIEWCQHDDFWRPNIMSMPKFRKRYDQLRLNAQNGRGRDRAQEIFDDADASEEDRRPAGGRVQGTLLPDEHR